jgi:hypothetical protein
MTQQEKNIQELIAYIEEQHAYHSRAEPPSLEDEMYKMYYEGSEFEEWAREDIEKEKVRFEYAKEIFSDLQSVLNYSPPVSD